MTEADVARLSVEYCLMVLAGRTEHQVDGFNPFDVGVGHTLAERVVLGYPLTGKQRRAAHRMLAKYRSQLEQVGVDYDHVPYPLDTTTAVHADPQLAAMAQAPRITLENGRIYVRSPFSLKDVARGINGGRWNARATPRGAWTYPESPRSALAILAAFGAHSPETDEGFRHLVSEGERMAAASVHKDAESLPEIPRESMSSWLHQRQAYWFTRELDAALLWMEMGTGKSKVTCDLVREHDARRSLIMCPSKVLGVWPKQFRLHGGMGVSDLVHVVNGFVEVGRGGDRRMEAASVSDRTRMFDNALYECNCERPHVVVMNYEAIAFQPFKDWALEQDWDMTILDESHRIRSTQGVWSKWCAKLRDRSHRRLCLTGTALGQNELDIFAQYRYLDPAIFGTSYTSFEKRYAVKGGYQGYEVTAMRTKPTKPDGSANDMFSPQLAEEFDNKLFSICYEVGAEVLDLPPERDIRRTFPLPPAARRAYRQLDDELYTDLVTIDASGGEVTAPNVLVKMLRLQQLTGGTITDDAGNPTVAHTGKKDLLEDVLNDFSPTEPIVVFCRFIPDLDAVKAVAEKQKRRYAELSGRRDDGLTEDSTLANTTGITAVQIQAGGVGVDFTASHVGVYYSAGFSRIDFVQSRRRLARPGQEDPVLFVHLIAESTIDVDVYDALDRNEDAVQYVAKRRIRNEIGRELEDA